MGFIGAAAAIIASIVTSVAVTVAVMVSAVVSAVISAVTAIIGAIAGVVSAITAIVSSAIAGAAAFINGTILPMFAGIKAFSIGVWEGVSGFVTSIQAGFKAFAEFIHLKTLLQIHQIAYMVSGHYRAMFQQMWTRVGEVGQALNVGASFMIMAYQNARSVVLTASGLLGRKYDLAEVTWLREFNKSLKWVGDASNQFMNNPAGLLDWIDQSLLKNSVDSMSGTMLTVYQALDGALNTVETTVTKVTELRDGVDKLVGDLPEFIRKRVEPMTDKVLKVFDDFRAEVYDPHVKVIDTIMNEVGDNLREEQENMRRVVDALKNPGDYVYSITAMSPEARADQERKVAAVVYRGYSRDVASIGPETLAREIELAKVAEALQLRIPPPTWYIPELEAPAYPPGAPIEPRSTWFVGDF